MTEGYLNLSGKRLSKVVKRTVNMIQSTGIRFDAIAFRGFSGAIVAPAVAMLFGKPLMLIRKETRNSHGEIYEGSKRVNLRYIIIDDFIATGKTLEAIMQVVNRHVFNAHLVAVFFYNGASMHTYEAFDFAHEQQIPIYYLEGRKVKSEIP